MTLNYYYAKLSNATSRKSVPVSISKSRLQCLRFFANSAFAFSSPDFKATLHERTVSQMSLLRQALFDI